MLKGKCYFIYLSEKGKIFYGLWGFELWKSNFTMYEKIGENSMIIDAKCIDAKEKIHERSKDIWKYTKLTTSLRRYLEKC